MGEQRKTRARAKWLDPKTPGGDADKTINAMAAFAESEITRTLDALAKDVGWLTSTEHTFDGHHRVRKVDVAALI